MRSTLGNRHRTHARSWLVVKGKAPEVVRSELRLRESRVPGDDKLTFQIAGATSDTGWYLIVARGRDHRLMREAVVKPLSMGCEVVTCVFDEENVSSAASLWREGARVWSITYSGEEGPADLVVDGELPLVSSSIRERYTALAHAPDAGDALIDPMSEVAVEIVHSLTGYKPLDSSRAFAGRFSVLEGLDTPWYKRWTVGG